MLSFLFTACFIIANQMPVIAAEEHKEEESFLVARKAFDDGFYDVSLGLLARFINENPSSKKISEAKLLIGQCYYYQGKYLDALAKFDELLKQPSALTIKDAVLYWIAEVHFKGNDFRKANKFYQRIIDEHPNSEYLASCYYSIGWCYFQGQEYEEALKSFEKVEKDFPSSVHADDAAHKIIDCLYNLKDYSSLKSKINSYIKKTKDKQRQAYLNFYLAEADYYLGDYNPAIDEYSKALLLTDEAYLKSLCNLGLGWAYLKAKNYQRADEVFQSVSTDTLEKKSRDALLLGEAVLLSETNMLNEARLAYEKLIAHTDDPFVLAQAYLGKSEAFYNLADYAKAIDTYKEALSRLSDGPVSEYIDKIHYGLAWAYIKEGLFKEAIDEFNKVAKQSEDKVIKIAALCQVGDTYQDSGEYQKAIETYDKLLRDYPVSLYNDYIQYQLGVAFLKSSKYDAAIMAFRKLENDFPNSKLLDEAAYALGLAYFQMKDYSASEEAFRKLKQEFKSSNLGAQATYLLGTSLYNQSKFQEAIEVFKDIARLYSGDKELMQKAEFEIAECYYQMGNEKEAISRFKALRSKYPDSNLTAEIMWWLGQFYYRSKELALAKRYFISIIRDFPKSSLVASSYYALGLISSDEGQYQQALDNLEKVISLSSSDLAAQAAVAMADIYIKQGDYDSSLKICKQLITKYKNLHSIIYPKIADIYILISDFKNAAWYYRLSLDAVPVKEMAQIQFKLAESIQSQGLDDEAIAEYFKVGYMYSANDELNLKSLLRIAAIYEKNERFREARDVYRKVVALNVSESKYAQERIDWINTQLSK